MPVTIILQFYHTQNGTDMSELTTNNRYNEYARTSYVGVQKHGSNVCLFQRVHNRRILQTARYRPWAAYPTTELTYVMTPAHILQLSFASDKTYPSYWDLSEKVRLYSGYEEVQGNPMLKPSTDYSKIFELYFKEQVYLQVWLMIINPIYFSN